MGRASTAAKSKWNAKAYDRLGIYVPKGIRDEFKNACAERGVSMNEVVRQAIEQFLQETPRA